MRTPPEARSANRTRRCVVAFAVLALLAVATEVRSEISRVSIDIPNALPVEFGSPPQRTVRLELFLDSKNVEAVLVLPSARNPSLAGWDARDVESNLTIKGGRLSGSVTANFLAAGRDGATPWKCLIDAGWKDGALAGRAECSTGNSSMSGRAFSIAPAGLESMNGEDGLVELFLPGAGEEGGVRAGIEFREGKAVAAASFSTLVHPVWRRLDASALALKKGRLSGKLAWAAAGADDDIPAAAARELELNLDLRDGFAPAGPANRGGVALLARSPEFPERAEVELAFDAPLTSGERWRRRAVVRLAVTRSAVTAFEFLNGRAEPGWSGVAEARSLERGPNRFHGAIEATVASATVQPGLYGIRFKGEIVGAWIVGTFESDLAGNPVAKGDFTGWFAPAGR